MNGLCDNGSLTQSEVNMSEHTSLGALILHHQEEVSKKLDEAFSCHQDILKQLCKVVAFLESSPAYPCSATMPHELESNTVGDEELSVPKRIVSHVDEGRQKSVVEDVTSHLEKIHAENEAQKPPKRSALERFLMSNPCEYAMIALVLINMLVMLISLQLRGLHAGWVLGERTGDIDHESYERFSTYAEYVFNSIYMVELLLLIYAQGRRFFGDHANIVDLCVVTLSSVDCFFLSVLNVRFGSWSALRFVRVFRIARLAKFLRYSKTFAELRIAIRTLHEAVRGVIWGVMLLFGITLAGVILITQLSFTFLVDDSIELQKRKWVYKHFGTIFASAWTMLETTFTGRWGIYARPMLDDLHYMFAVFWVLWVILVNFMTIRVISSLFIKSTLAVAAIDEEKSAMHSMKERHEVAHRIRKLFAGCINGNENDTLTGVISPEEFEEMLESHLVLEEFAALGLDYDHLQALFKVLVQDHGKVDYEEFITGALAMTSNSPCLDAMRAQQDQLKLAADVRLILEHVRPLAGLMSRFKGAPISRAACADIYGTVIRTQEQKPEYLAE